MQVVHPNKIDTNLVFNYSSDIIYIILKFYFKSRMINL